MPQANGPSAILSIFLFLLFFFTPATSSSSQGGESQQFKRDTRIPPAIDICPPFPGPRACEPTELGGCMLPRHGLDFGSLGKLASIGPWIVTGQSYHKKKMGGRTPLHAPQIRWADRGRKLHCSSGAHLGHRHDFWTDD